MIRIRKANGEVVECPKGTFVELVNPNDNEINLAFYQQDDHTVIQVVPGSVNAARYEGMFKKHGAKFAKTMILRDKS